jgi:hypothetical protein
LAKLVLHRSDHFLRGAEGAESSAFLEIVLGLSQTSIYDTPLRGGVLFTGSRELGAAGYELRSQYNLATAYRSFHHVAFGYTDSGSETARKRHLALAVDSNKRGHIRTSSTG